jgi:hypothetical protein
MKSHDKKIQTRAKVAQPVLERLAKHLEEGHAARTLDLDEVETDSISDLHHITMKKDSIRL